MPFWSRHFPRKYEKRPGQVEFIEEAHGTLTRKGIYAVSAPCGIGKSLAALISALPLVEEMKKLIIAYRTRNQLQIYLKELKAISGARGKNYPPVSVISKGEMCHKFKREEISYGALIEACRMLRENSKKGVEPACDFYKKILQNPDRARTLTFGYSKRYLSPLEICQRARKEGICPYEALKLILPDAEIFLGTYRYLFDPKIRTEILRLLGVDLSDCVVIVDEAHNLPAFARDLLSGTLTEAILPRGVTETTEFGGPDADEIRDMLEGIADEVFPELSRGLTAGEMRRIDPSILKEALKASIGGVPEIVAQQIHEYGEYIWAERIRMGQRVYSYNHRIGEFLSAFLEAEGPQYAHWIKRDEAGDVCLELRSLDGRELTNEVFGGAHSGIMMSGTLTPADVYRDLITRAKHRVRIREFESPFPSENRLILVARDVSSRIEERTQKTYERWCGYLREILRSNVGNVGVFFPSYGLMDTLLPMIETDRNSIVEGKRTTEREVVRELSKSPENVLFGVIGGKLAEGIDYPGELLTCSAVVGFPYAGWDEHQLALLEYMEKVFPGRGRLYGYLTPAIQRLLQACGRVHRSEHDEGCIVILDKRVYYPYIREKLPEHFKRELKPVSTPEECGRLISNFWEERKK